MKYIRSLLTFIWEVLVHKYYVFKYGLELGVPWWQLLLHDFCKFSPTECEGYVRRFHIKDGSDYTMQKYEEAWLHHQNSSPHHWEYWVQRSYEEPGFKALEMPDRYVREMVADWMAANKVYKSYEQDKARRVNHNWLKDKLPKMNLHVNTRKGIRLALAKICELTDDLDLLL